MATAGLSGLVVGLAVAVAASSKRVMNEGGVPYKISNPPGSTADWKGTPGVYSTNFNENVQGKVEHFDVYGEVQTKYSQVYWTRNLPIDLPPALVKRFEGKVMAITGYEVDQVTHDMTPDELNRSSSTAEQLGGFSCYPDCSQSDKSVPMYNAYNHHYFGWLVGKDAEVVDLKQAIKLPNPTFTHVQDKPSAQEHGFPTNIVFKENPGGEFRKSYHGYPSGFAQLLHSPTNWLVEPMQIDTHNRKYGITEEAGYHPSFLPKKVQNGTITNLKSGLSPLIECPCSTRMTRSLRRTSPVLTNGNCGVDVTSQSACAEAAAALATVASLQTVHNATLPAGCLITPSGTPGVVEAVFNEARSTAQCDVDSDVGEFSWQEKKGVKIPCQSSGCLPALARYNCTATHNGQCTWGSVEIAKAECAKYGECKGIFCSTRYSKDFACFGRQSTTTGPGTPADVSYTKDYLSSGGLVGVANLGGLVNLTVSHDGTMVNVTMTGPAGVWFGVGFDANAMADLPYAIIVDGEGKVSERRMGSHAPGTRLPSSIEVISVTTASGLRTVVLRRGVVGKTKAYWSFPTSAGKLNVITAVGNTVQLAYHAQRTGAEITLLPRKATACVCQPKITEYMSYMNKTTAEFHYDCVDEPRSDMLRHGDGTGRNVSNAACDVMTYNGGLRCCAHHNFLTDLEQDSLIPNKTDTYFLKWRYYFQEYKPADNSRAIPASHKHLHHWVFLIDDSVNDYEEDNAHYGHASIGHIEAHLTAREMGLEDIPARYNKIIPHVMTPHCHAPSCIRQELWNADTNTIICNITALYGDEKYGSTNAALNEANYIGIPPCIFGNQPGLQFPFEITPDTNLTAVKYFNNTFRHLGQMAQWTGLMVYDTDPY